MAILTVMVTPELIEGFLKTGNQVEKTVITEGLPDDAVFHEIDIEPCFGSIRVAFLSESDQGDDRDVNIILTMLRDV